MSVTGKIYIRNASANPDEKIYNQTLLKEFVNALKTLYFTGDHSAEILPSDFDSAELPFWGYIRNTAANVKTASGFSPGVSTSLKIKYLPQELDGDGSKTAAKYKEYDARMLYGKDATERSVVASTGITTASASASSYVVGCMKVYHGQGYEDAAWGPGTPFRFVGLHCAQTTAVETPTKNALSAANMALFPEEFDTMFKSANHNGAWWKANAKYASVIIKQNKTTAQIWYLVIFGASYIGTPRNDLQFCNSKHGTLSFNALATGWRSAAQIKADLGISPSGFPTTMYGQAIQHEAKSFALKLQYANFGVTKVNEFVATGEQKFTGLMPTYLKDRWDNVDGSGGAQDICALWQRKHAGWLVVLYTAAETSQASFRILSAGNGRVSFGSTSDGNSLFYNNPAKWATGNNGQRSVYVPNGATCYARAADATSGTDGYFKCWVNPKTGAKISQNLSIEVAHNDQNGHFDAVAVFTSRKKEASKTIVVVAGGYNGDTIDTSLYGPYRDYISVCAADGASVGSGEAKISPQGRSITAWPFAPAETQFSLKLNAREELPKILRRLKVGDNTYGYADMIKLAMGKLGALYLPSTGDTKMVLAEFSSPAALGITFINQDGSAELQSASSSNGKSGANFYEGRITASFNVGVGKKVSVVSIERDVSGNGTSWKDVTEDCGLYVGAAGGVISFELRDYAHKVTVKAEDIDYKHSIQFAGAGSGHGHTGAPVVWVLVNGDPAEDESGEEVGQIVPGETGEFVVHHGDSVVIKTGNVERASTVAYVEDTDSARIAVTEDSTGPDEARVFSAGYTANNYTRHFRVALGAEVSVSVAVPGEETPGEGNTGTAAVDNMYDEPGPSAVAAYGELVRINAKEYGNRTYGTLLGLAKGAGNDDRRDVIFGASAASALGYSFRLDGENAGAYTALFGEASSRVFVKIENKTGQPYGKVGLFADGDQASKTQYESEAAFEEALAGEGWLPAPPSQNSGVATPAFLSLSDVSNYTPPSTGPEWWSFKPGLEVAAICAPLNGTEFRFRKITFAPFIYNDGTVGEAVDVSRTERFTFDAYASGVLTVEYTTEERSVEVLAGAGGAVEIDDRAAQTAEDGSQSSGVFISGTPVTLLAKPAHGNSFVGWFSTPPGADRREEDLLSVNPVYTFTVSEDEANYTIWADFEAGDWVPLVWEGGARNMMMDWRSRRYTMAQPQDMVVVAVEADGYDGQETGGAERTLQFTAHYASSPDAGAEDWDDVAIELEDQDARRLPMPRRPERYVEVEVRADSPILRVAASTSMAGLIG